MTTRARAAGALALAISGGFAPLLAQNADERNGALTLSPTRTVAFTTTEGTYMDLDVSPDGRTIVFGLV
ncbi:MAG: hypothetical protein O2958_15110, partial [Gemmatimonadetes bacterium]|nr:hypothetical protein [Gemmatimonadota bacterium]